VRVSRHQRAQRHGDVTILRVDAQTVRPQGDGRGEIRVKKAQRAESHGHRQQALDQFEERDEAKSYGAA